MHNIESIYKDYFQTIYKYLICLTHNEDIAEELTQETFYKKKQKINTFKNDCKISVWLCQIAKNLWYDELKKNKKIKNISEDEYFSIQMINDMEDNIILEESKKNLYKKINNLNEQIRTVIYLRIVGDLTFKEIGCILGKTENWARITFYRGKEKLKEEKEDEGKK